MIDVSKLKYLQSHEWISVEGKEGVVGISDYAQKEISDIVFIELPKVGAELKQKEASMVIESVKAAFDIYAPVSGKVTAVNDKLAQTPQIVNDSPFDQGWLFKIELSNPDELNELLSADDYNQVKEKAH